MANPLLYDSVNDVLNAARVRLNDAIASLVPTSGKLLEDTAAFTQQAVNNAWRRFQNVLAGLGYSRLKIEAFMNALPPIGINDTIYGVSLDWTGYRNATTFNPSFALPPDLMQPDELWERPTSLPPSPNPAQFTTMDRIFNGLPKTPKTTLNKIWEWRDDQIFMPGATVSTDLIIRYSALIPDFADNVNVEGAWYIQQVPIVNALDSFANFVCGEFARARADLDAGSFDDKGTAAAQLIAERDSQRPLAIYKASEYSKMADRFTPKAAPPPGPARE